ncbi:hypothetical protein IMSAGC011_00168 [Lachnospiraceae bacterium]|nr:hypothetical protein IMSAGC011_00168 [Lachnospiraceae bacterium]
MKKITPIIAFIILLMLTFYYIAPVDLVRGADMIDNQQDVQNMETKLNQEIMQSEEIKSDSENKGNLIVTEDGEEGISESEISQEQMETEKEENTTETEEESTTEKESEVETEKESEIETEKESEIETEEESATEIEEESTTQIEEEEYVYIKKIGFVGDYIWDENRMCYYTQQNCLEIEICIAGEFNITKEIVLQINDTVLCIINDEHDIYTKEILLSEGCNKIKVLLLIDGIEQDEKELTIIQDDVPPIIKNVDGKEIVDNKVYQKKIINVGQALVFEVDEIENSTSGVKEVHIFDTDKKEIDCYTNISANIVTCTFTKSFTNTILEVFMQDYAGNKSAMLTIFLDTELPESQITHFVQEQTQRRNLYKEKIENNIWRIYTNKEQFFGEIKVQDYISGIASVEAEFAGIKIKPSKIMKEEGKVILYQFDFEIRQLKELITYIATDHAGNCIEITYEVFLDQTAPKCEIENKEIVAERNRTFQIPVCQDISGIWKAFIERNGKQYPLIANNTGYEYTFLEEEIDKSTERIDYTLYLIDKAGNIYSDEVSVLFDFTAPQISLFVYPNHKECEIPISYEMSGTIERYYTNTDCKMRITITDKTNGGYSSGEIVLSALTKENDGKSCEKRIKLENGVCEITAEFTQKQYNSKVYTLLACDKVGNSQEYTFELIYDSVKPIITIVELEEKQNKIYQNKHQLNLLIKESNFDENKIDILCADSSEKKINFKINSWKTEEIGHSTTLTFTEDGVYCFEIICTDKAGNQSIYKVNQLVIDTVAPKVKITYGNYNQDQEIYYNQTATITVIDKNFDTTQNHNLTVIPEGKSPIISKWKKAENTDEYTCTVHFEEDGAYRFQCEYKDKAGNKSNTVISDYLVTDHTPPLIHTSYMDKKSKTGMNLNISGELIIQIIEENFSKENVTVILYNQKDAKKTKLKVSWKEIDEQTNKTVYQIQEDGIYSVTVLCKDQAGNESEVYQSEIFLVDKNKPVVNISYEGVKQTDNYYKGSRIAKITVRDISFNENCTANFNISPQNIPVSISKWTKRDIEFINVTEYTCTVTFEQDGAYTFQFSCMDQAGNLSGTIDGGSFIIDNTMPNIQVEFEHTNIIEQKNYHSTKTAMIKIAEQNFIKENVLIEPIGLTITNVLPTIGEWSSDGIVHSATLSFAEDGIYGLRIKCKDKAGNEGKIALDCEKLFIIDSTAPSVRIEYNKDTLKGDKRYYAFRTAKVIVTDANFDENCEINFDFGAGNIRPKMSKWRQIETDYICEIFFEKDGEYHVQFSCKDKAGNPSNKVDGGNFVIDTIEPKITVTFDQNNAKNSNYYNTSRTATITITEQAFSEKLVVIEEQNTLEVDKLPVISRWKTEGEKRIATIRFTQEGIYGFRIVCSDLAGNTAKDYVSPIFVIDKTAPQIIIEGVCANSANNKSVIPIVKYTDSYLDEDETIVTLTGTNHKEQISGAQKSVITNGIQLSYPDFTYIKEMDDFYTLSVKAIDLAGNKSEEEINFSVNRFGSTYKISEDTQQLIENYYTAKAPIITITEVNIDALEYGEVTVSREGQTRTLIREKDYIVTKEGTDVDWKSYTYKIKPNNFESDGVYSVEFYSIDKARNTSDNRMKGKEITFALDTIAPSIVVDGIESDRTYKERERKITIDVKDNMYLTNLQIMDNGETILDMSANELQEKEGVIPFLLQEKDTTRDIFIIAKDRAKNEQILKFSSVLISSQKEVMEDITLKKSKNTKNKIIEKTAEHNETTETVSSQHIEGIIVPTYQNENHVLYGVSAAMLAAILITAGIIFVRKRRQKRE